MVATCIYLQLAMFNRLFLQQKGHLFASMRLLGIGVLFWDFGITTNQSMSFHSSFNQLISIYRVSISRVPSYPCICIWAKYSDLIRGHPKWWFSMRECSENALDSGLEIILICPDIHAHPSTSIMFGAFLQAAANAAGARFPPFHGSLLRNVNRANSRDMQLENARNRSMYRLIGWKRSCGWGVSVYW